MANTGPIADTGYDNITTKVHESQKKRAGGPPTISSHFKEQVNPPAHLAWLSQLSRYDNLIGSYYDYQGFVFDEKPLGITPTVYVVDSTFLNSHNVRVLPMYLL